MKYCLLLCSVLTFAIFTSCMAAPSSFASRNNLAGADRSSLAIEQNVQSKLGLRLITSQQGIVMTAGGETLQGNYQLDPYPDSSADIIYFDYSTEQCVRLSSEPNIGHDETSTAYVPSYIGGARCLVAGDVLYVIKSGQPYSADIPGNDVAARLYCMNLDGSERKIKEYGSGAAFSWASGVACDNENNLYAILNIVDRDNIENSRVALAVLGANQEGYEVICSWPIEQAVSLVGAGQSGLVVATKEVANGHVEYKLEKLTAYGDYDGVLLEWKDTAVTSYTCWNDILYYTKLYDTNIYRRNIISTAEMPTISTDSYPSFKGDSIYIMCEVRDGRLMLQLSNTRDDTSERAALHLESNTFSSMSLYAGEGDERMFVGIFAEGANDFMVNIGKFFRTRNATGTDGTPYTYEQGFQDYVLISKEDYWENRPEYRRFNYYQ